MTLSERTRFTLFQRKEVIKNKVVINISDDEVMNDTEIIREGNETSTQNLSTIIVKTVARRSLKEGNGATFAS